MTRHVAVIAVHGVGHHQPHEAARAAADLLATSEPGRYSPFVESPVRIPVTPVLPPPVSKKAPVGLWQRFEKLWNTFDERPEFVRHSGKQRAHPSPEIEYMNEQLSEYEMEGDECVYDTVSLAATRTDPATGEKVEVRVYDMYWTDLSRVATAGLRMIGELYQLLFYVSGLGRHTLDFACDKHRASRLWASLAFCHRYAERILVLWIPVLNLCLLGLAIVLLPQLLFQLDNRPTLIGAMTGFLALFTLAGLFAWRRRAPGALWPSLFGFVIVAAAYIAYIVDEGWRGHEPMILLAESWIFAAALIVFGMSIYDKRRPGATLVAVICVVVVGLMLMSPTIARGLGRTTTFAQVGLGTGAWLYRVLHLFWSFFIFYAAAVSVLGFIAWGMFKNSADRRTVWTANLSLTLPGFLVLVLNLGLWRGVFNLSEKYLDKYTADGVKHLIDIGTPWTLGFILAIAILALLSIVWSLLPSLMAEVQPRGLGKADPVPFGESLSQSFRWMRYCGEYLRWTVILLIPLTYALTYYTRLVPTEWVDEYGPIAAQMTLWVGLGLIAMIAGPGPLRALGMGLRTAIDVAIDVANWLRIYPRKQNPRAKICARFTSLLRNILAWRSADGAPFDRVVIFSHSQGTVISSELLRYLNLTEKPLSAELAARKPILFTMGCPLRQLYSQRFPVQYAWARHQRREGWPGAEPDPKELAIALWANAYRSGDYVGRHLWHPDGVDDAWKAASHQAPDRFEVCIGAGAHTHYWDDTAPQVGTLLDDFVRK